MESLSPDAKTAGELSTGWASVESFLDSIDTKLHSFGRMAEATAGEAQLKAHLGLLEAEELWGRTKTDLLKVIASIKKVQARPQAALEEGKLELYFGKEDAKTALAVLRQRLDSTEAQLEKLGKTASEDAKAALVRLQNAYDAIKSKLLN